MKKKNRKHDIKNVYADDRDIDTHMHTMEMLERN